MAIFKKIQRYINNPDRRAFKQFLAEKLKENPDFLQHSWNQEGQQVTLLGYLISQHEEASEDVDDGNRKDLRELILHILENSKHIEAGFPLHQAISSDKLALAKAMIKEHSEEDKDSASLKTMFNFDAFDNKGRSLLSLALTAADEELIKTILAHTQNIHQSSSVQIDEQPVEMQPIHQAIYLNLLPAVSMLIDKGAQLNNSCGPERNTPILLAAKSGQYEILKELLCSSRQLDLEATNAKGITAVGVATEVFKFAKTPESKDKAIQNIAMLLCHGAEVPQLELLKNELLSHREALLQAMDKYLTEQPKLVDAVVNRIHDKNSKIHSLVYENNSLVSIFQHLSNKPNKAALIVENWISRNAEGPASESQLDKDKIKFAEFVRRYEELYKEERFSNPWSSMRWMIASGRITNWEDVVGYAENHTKSRTWTVYKLVLSEESNVHLSMDNQDEKFEKMSIIQS